VGEGDAKRAAKAFWFDASSSFTASGVAPEISGSTLVGAFPRTQAGEAEVFVRFVSMRSATGEP